MTRGITKANPWRRKPHHRQNKSLGDAKGKRTSGYGVFLAVAGAYALVSNLLLFGADPPPAAPALYTPMDAQPHSGWQPRLDTTDDEEGKGFSWRECFDGTGVGANQPHADGERKPHRCREHPSDFAGVPAVNDTWIPDVTLVRAMLRRGRDRNGAAFPPPLPSELCEDMDAHGRRASGGGVDIPGAHARVTWTVPDGNKRCLRDAGVRPTGELTSDVVTGSPLNHFGVAAEARAHPNLNLTAAAAPAPRLLCLVYTTEASHPTAVRAIRDTWAGGCDGFLAFSTRSDPRIPAIHVPHEGGESYGNMWMKIRAIWKFVGTHYLDRFDWFCLGGDDLYVLPHNLRTYLASLARKDAADPRTREYFVGHRQRYNAPQRQHMYGFNTGGAGYVLSRAALRTFLAVMDDPGRCSRKTTSQEDVELSMCLRRAGVGLTDTRDARGRERFHFWTPAMRFHWDTSRRTWYGDTQREWGLQNGTLCCAPDSVSFHYVNQPSLVRHLHALLYHCDDGRR